MKRSDGAKAWATVLSELAQVRVSVGWGAADVAGLLAGRPGPGGTDEPGGRVGRVPGGCAAAVGGAAFRSQQLRGGGGFGAGEPGVAGVTHAAILAQLEKATGPLALCPVPATTPDQRLT